MTLVGQCVEDEVPVGRPCVIQSSSRAGCGAGCVPFSIVSGKYRRVIQGSIPGTADGKCPGRTACGVGSNPGRTGRVYSLGSIRLPSKTSTERGILLHY